VVARILQHAPARETEATALSAAVSVIVPVRNGESTLAECLNGLAAQSLPSERFEVIVVDDGSTDRTAEIARDSGARVVALDGRGAGGARNAGAKAASADWIAFTDADCIPSRRWLECLLDAAVKGNGDRPVGACGRTVGHRSDTAAARFVDLSSGLDAERHMSHPRFPFAPTGNLLYRRDLFEDLDGFDERYRSYEGCDLHTRALRRSGGTFSFEPRAVVLHRHRPGWRAYWKQQVEYGRGLAQFYLHYRDEIPWSIAHELRAVASLAGAGLRALFSGRGDRGLVRRGSFVKQLAQRIGFQRTYWNRAERRRW